MTKFDIYIVSVSLMTIIHGGCLNRKTGDRSPSQNSILEPPHLKQPQQLATEGDRNSADQGDFMDTDTGGRSPSQGFRLDPLRLQRLQKFAIKGDRDAAYELIYHFDLGLNDVENACLWTIRAAELGNELAIRDLLEVDHECGKFLLIEPTELEKVRHTAQRGDKNSAFRLYLHYRFGVLKAKEVYEPWLLRAVKLGHELAKAHLPPDIQKLRDMALKGNKESAFRLYMYYRFILKESEETYYPWLVRAACLGNEYAVKHLELYGKYQQSMLINPTDIETIHEKALKGDKDAVFRLFQHYNFGLADMEKGYPWLIRARDLGHEKAKIYPLRCQESARRMIKLIANEN